MKPSSTPPSTFEMDLGLMLEPGQRSPTSVICPASQSKKSICKNANNSSDIPQGTSYTLLAKERDEALLQTEDMREQLDALMEAMRLLTRIVTAPLPSFDASGAVTPTDERDDDEGDKAQTAQSQLEQQKAVQKLEQLQSKWKLEDTGFSTLANAVHQLRLSLSLVSAEADSAIADVQSAHTRVSALKSEKESMRLLIQTLYQRNKTLVRRLKTKRLQKRRIVEGLRAFVEEKKEAEEEKTKTEAQRIQMNRHQDTMMAAAKGFGNVLNLVHSPDLHVLVPTRKTCSFNSSASASTLGGDEWEDVSLLSSPYSASPKYTLVTDEGCATIRLAERGKRTMRDFFGGVAARGLRFGGTESPSDQNGGHARAKSTYERTFATSKGGIGLQFLAVPLIDPSTHYTVGNARLVAPPILSNEKRDLMMRHWKTEQPTSIAPAAVGPQEAYLVCGFRGSDVVLAEHRPTFGARLVGIDSISLLNNPTTNEINENTTWTLDRVWKCIDERCKMSETITLTFRNDVLSKDQMTRLQKAVP